MFTAAPAHTKLQNQPQMESKKKKRKTKKKTAKQFPENQTSLGRKYGKIPSRFFIQ